MDEPVDDRPAATWADRVGAWLVDVVLVAAVVGVLGDLLGLDPGLPALTNPLEVGAGSTLLFVYWTFFEGHVGQSPGKLVFGIKVVDRDGTVPSLPAAAVESFGKAFLLPLDVFVGLIAMPGRRLRLCNRLAGTRVVCVVERQRTRGPSAVEA